MADRSKAARYARQAERRRELSQDRAETRCVSRGTLIERARQRQRKRGVAVQLVQIDTSFFLLLHTAVCLTLIACAVLSHTSQTTTTTTANTHSYWNDELTRANTSKGTPSLARAVIRAHYRWILLNSLLTFFSVSAACAYIEGRAQVKAASQTNNSLARHMDNTCAPINITLLKPTPIGHRFTVAIKTKHRARPLAR